MLHEKNCFVKQSQDSVGYIGPIRTMKYARRLLAKWHNKLVDGQRLQCQIEWCERFSMAKPLSRPGSMSNFAGKETNSPRLGRSDETTNDSRNSSRRNSTSRDGSDSGIVSVDDKELNYEPKLYHRSREDIIKQNEADMKHKTKLTENLPLSTDRKCMYIIISIVILYYIIILAQSLSEISEGGRKMTKIRNKTDGSSAFLIEYNDRDKEIYRRELNALQLLKGKNTNEYK
jgi:hypothetical protein